MSELVPLSDQLAFAKALADAALLPAAYRRRPADILLAMQYAESLGIPVMQAIVGVHVIDGRPSMSAELMQALVRRAGHRLRVESGDNYATCTIIRRDDPEYSHTVSYTLEDAQSAGLLKKGSSWERHPKAMLVARAVSACCRLACADVLAGVSYVPEELQEPRWADPVTVVEERTPDGWYGEEAWRQALAVADTEDVVRGLADIAGDHAREDLVEEARAQWKRLRQDTVAETPVATPEDLTLAQAMKEESARYGRTARD